MELSDRLIISKPLYLTEPNEKCGYCSGKKSDKYDYFASESWWKLHEKDADMLQINNCTLGLQVELMPVDMYDDLCNLGFRRSGNFLYKADLLRNCCRLYTIRTTPDQCQISKELKTCVTRFRKRITTGADETSKQQAKPRDKSTTSTTTQLKFDYIQEIVQAELKSNNFFTRFEPAMFTMEKYNLFVKYQENVHNDFKNSIKSFKRFLCESPFPEDVVIGTQEEWDQLNNWHNMKPGETLKRVGPVHECYYFENKLIALAVTDFLPSGISSVYFIWDPDFPRWSLGKLSALRELSILSKINRQYYYLGYYVDDCPKMRYKRKYGGDILDVCNNQYVPLDLVTPLVENGKFFVLDHEARNRDKDDDEDDDDDDEDDEDDEESDVVDAQFELPLDDVSRLKLTGTPVNIVDKIYGEHGGAILSANEAVEKLVDLGIEYTPTLFDDLYRYKMPSIFAAAPEPEITYEEDDDGDIPGYMNEIYHLPNVVPGLLPLWQILQIIESGDISRLNNKLMLYNVRSGQIRVVADFAAETKRTKRVICNVIRMIGLKSTAKSLIII
ncbi:LAME_0F01376g1_1 [Lachancea meyersii CBS 8951]|uniref:arginyltransferase n=1 Tax=Lachancea meyersii CBS 8951 TaxID=1266667 RepID=A0A1G4JPR6_9SACH|nr:LAME_0F01376g1_1 [Lachancea meyersii CBS 8951]